MEAEAEINEETDALVDLLFSRKRIYLFPGTIFQHRNHSVHMDESIVSLKMVLREKKFLRPLMVRTETACMHSPSKSFSWA